MKSAHLIGLVAMGLLSFAASGNAAISVYHSTPGGMNPGVPFELPNTASEPLELNVHGGNVPTNTGTICVDGDDDGQEVCGVEVTIGVINGSILGFVVNPGASSRVVSHSSSSNEIRIVAVLAVPSPTTDPFHLGTLTVDATDPNVKVSVISGEAVASNGQIMAVPQDTIALPEPAQWLMLAAGSSALAALGRRRSRQAKRRV